MSKSWVRWTAGCAAIAAMMLPAAGARADEGGVSFWVPGFFGSLASTPQQPGWSLATIGYHTSVSAGGNVAFARQVSRGNITANLNGFVNANLKANADLGFVIPTYVFATPFLGAQAAVALIMAGGRNKVSADASLVGNLGPFGFARGIGVTDEVSGIADLIPQASLRWNFQRAQRDDLHHR